MRRLPILVNICTYRVLRRLLKNSPCSLLIYPYEEKGIERAMLYACQENNVRVMGYTPHPQHWLALSLKDTKQQQGLRPSRYAVCGKAYIDYLRNWAGKSEEISVWGSGKTFHRLENLTEFGAQLKVLLLVSHPNELKVFSSWLQYNPSMTKNIHYFFRPYGALKSTDAERILSELDNKYSCITITSESLYEDLAQTDLAVFCATSAGIAAVKHGRLAIHLCLDDFFAMDPCFDNVEPFLSCQSAQEFIDRVQYLKCLTKEDLNIVYEKQQAAAEDIFGKADSNQIKDDLLNVENKEEVKEYSSKRI